MEKPLVSVVIPVYNEEKRIKRVLRSMQQQTYPNLEIIVVDDGSTDNTVEVVREMAVQDPRIIFRHNPKVPKRTNWRGYDINAGFSARNFGFKIAQGEWLTTQDADDASLLNRIEVQYELAQKYQATCVAIQWQELKEELLTKKLDVERVFADKGEKEVIVRPEEILFLAQHIKGVLMMEPLHRFIPFSLKWFPYTRKLFYRDMTSYPGADNSLFFHHKVRDEGVLMRPRNQRTWGAPSGRGSGRDFAFRVAVHFKNSWAFKLPMYLWDVKQQNAAYTDYDKYLI